MEANSSAHDTSAAGIVARIRKALEQGAPWDACDAFREAGEALAGDADLLWWGALAHARSGAMHAAQVLLDRAEAASPSAARLTDIQSMRGRLWKDAYHRGPQRPGATELARRAFKEYLTAYGLDRDSFPGINAATLSWVLGDRDLAQRLAREVAATLAAQAAPRNFWDVATAGEAQLLLGHLDRAREQYAAAYADASSDAGSVATMRRQISLLAPTLPEARAILDVLPVPDVVAFAGHMIDAPTRPAPRFPRELVPAVEAAVRERLARFHRPIVYSSAACGADLICIETALATGAEVNIVLPFDRADFIRTSVAVGGDEWIARFDAAIARAARVIMATEENHLGDDVLFDHAAMLLEGFTCLRAAQLETMPSLLCVMDAASDARVGGTHATFARWRQHVGAPQVIDLSELRRRALPAPYPGRDDPLIAASMSSAADREVAPVRSADVRPRRTLKTLLFADFAGFSRLHDAMAPLFQERFWAIAAGEIAASAAKPLLSTTWGDALYVVFEAPGEGADFALRFLDRMREADWPALGLPESSQIRIALHAGPVFCGFDPIMRCDNYFGSSVTKAARIEPVTP
ncbi:MAG TPA: tetratricopeptide repeat-containing protein, partial [Casimicrobiaceae bacterium]|nr:tetratricopeptide repeat-containing protein [Casimicrobiaceae bacterium]